MREAILNGEEGARGWAAMRERHGGLVKVSTALSDYSSNEVQLMGD